MAAGWLAIAHIVLVFAGNAFGQSLRLGDKPSSAVTALVHSSLTTDYAGGYVEFVGFLVFLVGAMLLARLLRGDDEITGWLSSCISASAITYVAVTVATGFAAGAAALYDGHHGASLATVTTVSDIRNFGFFLSGGVVGVFALSVAAAVHRTGLLGRWVAYSGYVVGVLCIGAVPAARTGLIDVATMLWFVWFVAVGVAALRRARRSGGTVPRQAAATV